MSAGVLYQVLYLLNSLTLLGIMSVPMGVNLEVTELPRQDSSPKMIGWQITPLPLYTAPTKSWVPYRRQWIYRARCL